LVKVTVFVIYFIVSQKVTKVNFYIKKMVEKPKKRQKIIFYR